MLNLAPPQFQIGRMFVFSDSADPSQFYYLPNFPHIALTEEGKPAISLLVFKRDLDELPEGAEDAVAFLSLDVDVSFKEEEIQAARSFIRTELNRLDEVKLSPIFFRRGTAKLLLLDAKTPEPGKENDPGAKTEFVLKLLGTSSPSLFGDNRAIFQAMLSKEGAQALMGSFDGLLPIGVVYELTFAGLQPAFHIKLKADWKRVYNHFSEREVERGLFFYEHEVNKVVDDLVDQKVIQVEDVIEGVDEEGLKTDHDAVMAELRRFMLETFFTQTLNKEMPAGHDISGEIGNAARSITRAPFEAIFGGYSYVRKEVSDTRLQSFEADWSTRKAVERTVFPQAHLSTLIREGGLTRDDVIKVVDGEDELFRTLELDVSALAAWDRDGVALVSVDIEHGGSESEQPKSLGLVLDKAVPRQKRRAWLDPRVGAKIRYRYETVFLPEGVWGPDAKIASDWIDHEGTVLGIRPDELYRMVDAEVSAVSTFPFERWPAVHAWVRLKDEALGFEHVVDGVITSEKRKLTLRFRAPIAVAGPLDVRLRHLGVSGKVVETGWMPLEGTAHAFADPQPNRLSVTVIPSGDRSKIANLFVDFEYRDDDAGRFEGGQVAFETTTMAKPQTWSIPLDDPQKRRYRYKLTIVKVDGEFLQTGWIESESPTLPAGELYVKLLDVEVSLFGEAPGVERVRVDLAYEDAAHGIDEHKSITLHKAGDRGTFQVRLQDAAKQEFSYTITWVSTDGFDRVIGPMQSSDRFVVVSAAPPTS